METATKLKETQIHPQIRSLVARLCEAFNTPLTNSKLIVWQEKLKIPNPTLIKETYDLITDGKGDSLKMPSIAEFLKIYKERERLLTQKISEEKQIEYNNNINYTKSAQMFTKLKNTIKNKPRIATDLCSFPVNGFQDGRKFTLTRDDEGRDWVEFKN